MGVTRDHNRDRVDAHLNFGKLDAVSGTGFCLRTFDGAGGVIDNGLTGAKFTKATPRTRDAHAHFYARISDREVLSHGLGNGENGARTVDENTARDLSLSRRSGQANHGRSGG